MSQAVQVQSPTTRRGAFSGLAGWLDDRMNPIVVKELRQAVRSKFVISVLQFFLLVELTAIGLFMLMSDDVGRDFETGQSVFMTLQALLLGVCLLFIPAYVGIRMAMERAESNVDLLYITTIRPSSIIWGKFLSGVAVAVLLYSASAPFMVLTYLMRGVDVPTILLVLGLNLLVTISAIQLTIAVVSIGVSTLLKVLLGLTLAIVLLMAFWMTTGGAVTMVYFGIGGSIASAEFWGFVLNIVGIFAACNGLLFFFSVAMISPASSNRALPVRVYLIVTWLATGAIVLLAAWMTGIDEFFAAWSIVWLFTFAVLMTFVVNERDQWSVRLLRDVPRSRLLRPFAFLLYSGAAGGALFCILMMIVNASLFFIWMVYYESSGLRRSVGMYGSTALACYAIAYSLTAMLIARYVIRRGTMVTLPVMLLMLGVGCVLPPLVMFFINPTGWYRSEQSWMLANPFGTFAYDSEYTYRSLIFAGCWAAFAMAASVPWVIGRWCAFKPYAPASVAESA